MIQEKSKLPLFVATLHSVLRYVLSCLGVCWQRIARFCRAQRRGDSLAVIELYRRGPTQVDRWNLLLWRLTFPIFTLLACVFLVFVGQCGTLIYTLIACPIWYCSNFMLEGFPFFFIYKYRDLSETFTRHFWKALALISVLISWLEVVFSEQSSRFAWLIGNSMYGCIGLLALPAFFFVQQRCVRETASQSDVDSNPVQWIKFSTANQPTTYVVYVALFTIAIVWLVTWTVYLSPVSEIDVTSSFGWLYILAPVVVFVYLSERKKEFRYNFAYLVFYGVTVVHIPNFLGHLSLSVFSMAQMEAGEHVPAYTQWIKFLVSVMYLLIMQGYFNLLLRVVQNMSEPFTHPSLMYIGQLYYYMFWYLMVGNDAPIDSLYVSMLLINTIHIVLVNTGLYTDIRQWQLLQGLETPIVGCLGSSRVLCFRRPMMPPRCRKSRKSEVIFAQEEMGPASSREEPDDQLKPLYFLMKMAEQDNMADTSALVLVPTLLTILAVLDAPSQGVHILTNKLNLWLRCIFMFVSRVSSSYLAQEIFAYKLKSRMKSRSKETRADLSTSRVLIQGIMLQDFQNQFWYLTIVTIVCTFSCFERFDSPARFAFLNN